MNAEIETLLRSKPPKEVIFTSVVLSKDYWKESCKQQCSLVKKQQEEHQKLVPSNKLYKILFNV